MEFPTINEYHRVIYEIVDGIHSISDVFCDNFPHGDFTLNDDTSLFIFSGGQAVVFQYTDKNGIKWALKLFYNSCKNRDEIYSKLSLLQQSKNHNEINKYFTPLQYFSKGIKIYNQHYPVLLTQWVDGKNLSKYIQEYHTNNDIASILSTLYTKIITLSEDLQRAGIVHNDIHFENIVVDGSTNLKLIDYDNIYIKKEIECIMNVQGIPHFNHPKRLNNIDPLTMDNFSFWIIVASIAIIIEDNMYINHTQGEDTILFFDMDLQSPNKSKIFQKLMETNIRNILTWVYIIISFLNRNPNTIPSLSQQEINGRLKGFNLDFQGRNINEIRNEIKKK